METTINARAPLYLAYLKHRASGVPPRVALVWARDNGKDPGPDIEWNSNGDRGEIKIDGFDIVIRVAPDELWGMADDEYYGTFTDNGRHPDAIKRTNHGWGECQYWIPSESRRQQAAHYRKIGYARGPAWERAGADIRRQYAAAEEHARDGYVVWIQAFVYRKGVKLGGAHIGGVDLTGLSWSKARATVAEAIRDHGLLDEALSEARDTLADLRAD